MPHILVVDDDVKIRLLLRRCLEGEGFQVSETGSGKDVARLLSSQSFDLVTLDLHLPDGDGLSIGREIQANSRVPIIMVTGKSDEVDRIIGLEVGADDYITKPFHLREFLARVRAVLRRTANGEHHGNQKKSAKQELITFGDWMLNISKRELRSTSGAVCELTTSEFDMLVVFAKHANAVLSRDQIMNSMRGIDWNPTDRRVDNLVMRLRQKIDAAENDAALIKTVRNVGYCFTADVEHVG